VGNQVRFVDQKRFKPQADTEYDSEFAMAAKELVDFYKTPYFGHNANDARYCATMRILEVTDEMYARAKLIEFGFLLHEGIGPDGLVEIANTNTEDMEG
jgi:hypothetical protein